VVFDRGPEASEDFIWDAGILLGGVDPVAVDAVGLHLLNQVRTSLALTEIEPKGGALNYLDRAASRGLGASRLHQIKLVKIKL
jgi:hypothetical protein